MITCSVLLENAEDEFFCSFIYASNSVEERRVLWEDLTNHKNSPLIGKKPWIVLGDFNEILDIDEHSGYDTSPTIPHGMRDFQDTVGHCSLLDMSYQGPRLTWCNKRDEGLICKKLDRTLMNAEWLQKYPQAYCVFEAGGCSDHLRCRIWIQSEHLRPKRPFKFTNAVTEFPGFLPRLKSFWENTVPLFSSTTALYRLSKRLKDLKPLIRELSKEQIGDISKRTKEAFEKLCDCQTRTLTTPTPITMEEERIAHTRWTLLSQIEEKVLSQKAKMHWLKVGDSNNKHFHNAAKVREVRNSIHELHRDDGTIAETQEELKQEAVNYFQGFLSHRPADYRPLTEQSLHKLLEFECQESDQAMLTQTITEEEIKQVLFAMPNNKTPGPDGYTTEFYKTAWPIVGKDFTVAIQSFFATGFLPKGINSTILALIPKKSEAKKVKDYRPISCCNVLYKVISKILANRLKQILPKFISPSQSAFVKDRLLMENVLLASELVKSYHKDTVSPRCAMKIDISKAFDSVQWPFLLAILSALKIPDRFILWIEKCITLASFSVQINGELAGYFNSKRGLRQGCSLSPYLFVICMEVLSKMLDKAATDGKLGYHPYCKALNLTHLCFADDLLVFADGKKQSVSGILEVFSEFAAASGLNISLEKSTLYIAGVLESEKHDILHQFPSDSGSLPVRYLGLPLMTKRMSVSDYTPLIEQIRRRISSWTARHLSFAGRLQLISSVIHSITNFWISAFKLPKSCITDIDSLCSAFLWSGPALNSNKAKVAWKDVCRPKAEGGLDLRSLSEANTVSCLKLIWRLLSSKTSLWVKWVHCYLIRKGSFWLTKDTNSLGSWMWKKLLKYRPLADTFTRVEIQSGSTTSFWFDNWSTFGKLYELIGVRGCVDLGIGINATVKEAVQNHRRRRHRIEILNLIENEIQSLRSREINHGEDIRMWRGKNDKYVTKFSSKETWHLTREVYLEVWWHEAIWFKLATPKFSFNAWLAILGRLSTGERVKQWNHQTDASCSLCNDPWETRDHLFFKCRYSEEIWSTLSKNLLNAHYTADWDSVVELLVSTSLTKLQLFISRYLFQTTIYMLWRERNGRQNGEQPETAGFLIRAIDKQMRSRIASIHTMGVKGYEEAMVTWLASRQ